MGVILLILALLVPFMVVIGSIVLLIVKIIERNKEKKNEHLEKYDKY